MRSNRSTPDPARRLRACAAAAAVLCVLGCTRPLALQHEYFAPGSGVAALANVKSGHAVSHHRALQAAQRACDHPAPDEPPDPGPDDPRRSAALRALGEVCAGTVVRTGPVTAHGASANAFRRWTEDEVRELPTPSETATSAAGG